MYRKFAILFLDLDGFKNVNDTLGHEAGDQLLRLVGVRLEGTIRKTDTVARQGGDEFIVLLNMINCHSDVIVVADKIIAEICKLYMIGTAEAEIGVSIGIAIYPDDETDLDSLLQRADRSLYYAKANEKILFQTVNKY
jgi:diguanylate cyclase (GGDEF)-like protein